MTQRRPNRLPTSNLGANFVSSVSSLFGRRHDQIIGGRIVRPPALKPMPLRRSDGHAHCDIRNTFIGNQWQSVALGGNQGQSHSVAISGTRWYSVAVSGHPGSSSSLIIITCDARRQVSEVVDGVRPAVREPHETCDAADPIEASRSHGPQCRHPRR